MRRPATVWPTGCQATFFIDHTLPWQTARARMGDLADLPSCPGCSAQSGDLAIGRDPARRNAADYSADRFDSCIAPELDNLEQLAFR